MHSAYQAAFAQLGERGLFRVTLHRGKIAGQRSNSHAHTESSARCWCSPTRITAWARPSGVGRGVSSLVYLIIGEIGR